MRALVLPQRRGTSTCATHHPDEAVRTAADELVDLLTPSCKGLCTDLGVERHLARHPGPRRHGLHRGDRRRPALPRRPHHPDLRGHQRHPGHGPRRPQARRARRRRRCAELLAEMRAARRRAGRRGDELAVDPRRTSPTPARRPRGGHGLDDRARPADPDDALAGATPFLRMFGLVAWRLAAGPFGPGGDAGPGHGRRHLEPTFLQAKVATARFYADQLLPQAGGPAAVGDRRAPPTSSPSSPSTWPAERCSTARGHRAGRPSRARARATSTSGRCASPPTA